MSIEVSELGWERARLANIEREIERYRKYVADGHAENAADIRRRAPTSAWANHLDALVHKRAALREKLGLR